VDPWESPEHFADEAGDWYRVDQAFYTYVLDAQPESNWPAPLNLVIFTPEDLYQAAGLPHPLFGPLFGVRYAQILLDTDGLLAEAEAAYRAGWQELVARGWYGSYPAVLEREEEAVIRSIPGLTPPPIRFSYLNSKSVRLWLSRRWI